MDADKIRNVLLIYHEKFEELEIPKKKAPDDSFPPIDSDYMEHCHAMLDEMEVFLEEGETDKLFRWLGFIQGCLWYAEIFTIEELKNHNRP